MIQPTAVTNFSRSDDELETFWLFCLFVAGKNSDIAANKVGRFLQKRGGQTPFAYLRGQANSLHNLLVANKVGQYGRLERAITQSVELDLRAATLADLTAIHGVGPKTARFFLLHSRRDCECAVLDVHILRWLREECGVDDAPAQTPAMGEQYERLERLCLSLMKAHFPGLSVAEIDLLLWTKMSGRF